MDPILMMKAMRNAKTFLIEAYKNRIKFAKNQRIKHKTIKIHIQNYLFNILLMK